MNNVKVASESINRKFIFVNYNHPHHNLSKFKFRKFSFKLRHANLPSTFMWVIVNLELRRLS
jgi:hypothetical protein